MEPRTDAPSKALPDLMDMLARIGEDSDPVRVGDVIQAVGERSHAIVLLVPAMILVSPLSGIFGLSTLTAIVMALIIVQALLRRQHMWLPAALARRGISQKRFLKAVAWLRRPIGWVDRHAHQRLQMLVAPPLRLLSWLISLGLCLLIPFLELLPFTTSLAAFAISLMALGMALRDGLYVLAGWAVIGGFAGLLWWFLV